MQVLSRIYWWRVKWNTGEQILCRWSLRFAGDPQKKPCCLWATKKPHDAISLSGVSTEDLAGPKMANLGQAIQDLKRQKSRALGPLYRRDRTLEPEMFSMRRTNILGAAAPELQTETGFGPAVLPPGSKVKSFDPILQSPRLGPMTPLDRQSKGPAFSQPQVGENYEPMVSEGRDTASLGATLATGGVRQQPGTSVGSSSPQLQRATDYDSSRQQSQWTKNCGATRDLSDVSEINRPELLGSETQSAVPQGSKHLGHATPQSQEEGTYGEPLPKSQDVRGSKLSVLQGQTARKQGVKDLVAKHRNGPRTHETALHPRVQGGRSYEPVSPGAGETQSLGIASVQGQEGKDFIADIREAKHLSQAESGVTKSKALGIPGQSGTMSQATSKSQTLSLSTITAIPQPYTICPLSVWVVFLFSQSCYWDSEACCVWKVSTNIFWSVDPVFIGLLSDYLSSHQC